MFKFTSIVILDLTEGCNITCDYCLMLNKDRHKGEVMDFALFKKIINKIIRQRILQGVQHEPLTVVFHGGEPMTVGPVKLYAFAEYAYTAFKNAGINFLLGTQTNGTLLTDEILKILKKFDFSIGLSLDDLGPGNDYRIPNSKDFFEKKLQLMEKNGFPAGVISVVTDKNVQTMPDFMDSIVERGGSFTMMRIENPDDRDFTASNAEIHELYKKIIEDYAACKRTDQKLSLTVEMGLVDMLTHHQKTFQSGCGGKICGTAIGMISVRPDGWFGNCDRFPDEVDFNNLLPVDEFDFCSIVQLQRAVYLADEKHKLMVEQGCDTCRADYICPHGCMIFDYHREGKFNIKQEECDAYKNIYDYLEANFVRLCTNLAMNNAVIPSTERIFDVKDAAVDILEQNGVHVSVDINKQLIGFSIKE